MDFGLSEDQSLFSDALRRWLGENAPLSRVREIMESKSGHEAGLLGGLAEQGVCGIVVPESYGGTGLGLLDAVIAAIELGRAATPISFHSACIAAPLAVAASSAGDAKEKWLPAVAAGRALLSFAVGAPPAKDGRLSGSVRYVPDAGVADGFVFVTGENGRREAWLVERDTPGLRVEPLAAVDETRRMGELVFDEMSLEAASRLQGVDPSGLDRIVDAARIVLAADAFGASARALEESIAYAATRKQFRRVVASFQGVKHICADAYAELEPLRAFLWYAAFAWDQKQEDARRMAALSKAHASDAATAAVTTAVQVFGGMGFTWECDAHIWFKRVGYDRQMLGGPTELRALSRPTSSST